MLNCYLKNRVIFHLIIGAVLISFSSIWVELAHVSPLISGFYRVFFGFFFLLSASVVKREIRKNSIHKSLWIVLCGFLFFMDLFCWHHSINQVGPGLATLLANFQVFLLALIGFLFLKESVGINFIFSIALALLGLFLIVGIQWNSLGINYKTGVYMGLAAAMCYSGFLLTLKKIQSDEREVSLFYCLMLVSLIAALFLGITSWASGESFVIPDFQSLAALLALGLFSQVIGWVLIANALPKVQVSQAGLILLLQPALAFLWDVLFFNRETGLLNWTGVIITLAAIYLGMTGSEKK